MHSFPAALAAALLLAGDGGVTEVDAGTGSTLRLEIADVRSDKGRVLMALYRAGDGFAETKGTAFRKDSVAAKTGTVTIEVKDLPPGSYAIAYFHDENDNQKLDTGFLGLPLEGFCFSKNARGTFGPPSFKDAAVTHGDGGETHRVSLKY